MTPSGIETATFRLVILKSETLSENVFSKIENNEVGMRRSFDFATAAKLGRNECLRDSWYIHPQI
jgi:hypothetical protein